MLNAVRSWILLSTLLAAAGWILSALHQLNRTGYLAVFALAGMTALWWRRRARLPRPQKPGNWRHKFRRRFRRPAPMLFLALALLSLLSGSLYAGVNFDANGYRLPRIFHWLWANQWHWIHTFDSRTNISASGHEWLSTPLVAFSRNDRLIFLINWVSFLMLPGLIFSVFTRLRVRPRVAWWWMWFLSSGWCFVLQAASVGNDGYAAVYLLAAIDLALRARQNGRVSDLWLSLLAAALLTNTKQTNLPLVLLWLIAAWPAWRLLWSRPVGTAMVGAIGLLVSVAPVCLFNIIHCGSWLPLEEAGVAVVGKFNVDPFWGVIGNAFCIPMQNLLPPFYGLLPPFYIYLVNGWNEWMVQFLQTPFGSHFASFEKFGFLSAGYYHGISEGNAGVGLGVCLLAFIAVAEAWRLKKRSATPAAAPKPSAGLRLLRLTPWGLLLLFMAKVGTFENARHLAPYYPLLFPSLLARAGQDQVVRLKQWQGLGLAVMVVTCLLVIASCTRPLFPARTVFGYLHAKFPASDLFASEQFSYSFSGFRAIEERRDYLQKLIPPGEKIVGYYAGVLNSDEPALWLPLGSREVRLVLDCPEDSPEQLRQAGIHYVLVNCATLEKKHQNIEDWMRKYDGTLAGECVYVGDPVAGAKRGKMACTICQFLVRLN